MNAVYEKNLEAFKNRHYLDGKNDKRIEEALRTGQSNIKNYNIKNPSSA